MKKGMCLANILILTIAIIFTLIMPSLGRNIVNGMVDSGKSWCDSYSAIMQIQTEWHTGIGCVAIYSDGIHKIIHKDTSLSTYPISNNAIENKKMKKLNIVKNESVQKYLE